MRFPWLNIFGKNRSSHPPYKGLLLGALGVSGIAATAIWMGKKVKAQRRLDWTEVEPMMPDSAKPFQPPVQKAKLAPITPVVASAPDTTIQAAVSAPVAIRRGKHRRGEEDIDEAATELHPSSQPSKMISGGEELRDHDFPLPVNAPAVSGKTAMEDTGKLEPEAIRSGGAVHTKPGDDPVGAEVTSIMDQNLATPDFAQG